jgi:hypothetical protein
LSHFTRRHLSHRARVDDLRFYGPRLRSDRTRDIVRAPTRTLVGRPPTPGPPLRPAVAADVAPRSCRLPIERRVVLARCRIAWSAAPVSRGRPAFVRHVFRSPRATRPHARPAQHRSCGTSEPSPQVICTVGQASTFHWHRGARRIARRPFHLDPGARGDRLSHRLRPTPPIRCGGETMIRIKPFRSLPRATSTTPPCACVDVGRRARALSRKQTRSQSGRLWRRC